MVSLGLNCLSFLAIGEFPNDTSTYYIETDFILWRGNEKMIDTNFTIHLYYINIERNSNNISYNNTYSIEINNDIREGNLSFYKNETFGFPDKTIIFKFKISIGNKTLLDEKNVYVIGDVDSFSVKRSLDEYTINLSPFQWGLKEKNIVYSVITSAILSIFISYVATKYYRKKYGVKKIGGD